MTLLTGLIVLAFVATIVVGALALAWIYKKFGG